MHRTILGLLLSMVLAWGGATARADGPRGDRVAFFELRVRPVLAGKCVRGHGETKQSGGVHVHDFHATILRLMGLDHTRLTRRDSGRDSRLTDVHGKDVGQVIA